jgi:hypothetical protein
MTALPTLAAPTLTRKLPSGPPDFSLDISVPFKVPYLCR